MKKIYTFCLLILANQLAAQTLAVQADKYLQNFEGAGISAGLYMGHHYSMPNPASQDLAVRYIARDLNMRYIQDYINIYPADDPAYFDRRANYLKAAKAYRSDIQVSMVGNKFPDLLMVDSVVGGQSRRVLRTGDPQIYNKVADWYFQLFKAFKERGVEVDILNVVNEPDFDKEYYYGADGNTKRNVALIFENAVTRFLAMLADASINTLGMKKPLIMGPSTISPDGCVTYIKFFKQNHPQAWALLDIVAYHQYINGVNAGALAQIKVEAAGKLVYQSEMHTNRGDNLGTLPISDELRGCLSLATVFGNALRTGANCWFYFQTNYPNAYTPAGLLSIPWQAANPVPYKHYYAFKQLSSAQPINSSVLEHIKTDLPKVDIVCLRKKLTDTLYIHASNVEGVSRTITMSAAALTGKYKIAQYQVRTTNEGNSDQASPVQRFTTPANDFVVTLSPYSVNTITVALAREAPANSTDPSINIYSVGNTIELQGLNSTLINAVQLVSTAGQTVVAVAGLSQSNYSINHAALKSGLYFFRIQTNKGWLSRKFYFGRE
jgi:hypothetical protein